MKPGWLNRQFARVEREFREWPESMKRAYFREHPEESAPPAPGSPTRLVGVFCCQRFCRWKGFRHPKTAYAKPCPRCGGRLIGDGEYRRGRAEGGAR